MKLNDNNCTKCGSYLSNDGVRVEIQVAFVGLYDDLVEYANLCEKCYRREVADVLDEVLS